MTQAISNKSHWQQILIQQKLANARRWLSLIESQDDPTTLVSTDYDNFLRALETTLLSTETFDLAYQLIQSIYIFTLDYADWDRWLIYLEKALEISKKLHLQKEEATLLVQIGDTLYRMANLKRAKKLYKRASELYKNLNDPVGYANTLTKTAILIDLQGKINESIALCQQALDIAEGAEDKEIVAQVHVYLSRIYYRSRNWEAALDTAQKAYEFYRLKGPTKLARKTLMNIIAIWAELGKWQEVDDVSKKLVNELTASGDIRTLSQLKNNLGVVAFNQKQYQVAEGFWQEALNLHSQIQEPTEQATLYNNLGVVYTLISEWQAAEEMLNRAVASHKQLGDVYNWANSLDNLADLYEAQGETAVSRQILQEAHTGLLPIADSPHALELLNSIAKRLERLTPQ
ncbi:MAG: tetratricopeptide repeat protein [Ardenticatenaceae bacterium]|nr:tetratricopeptide repeat protein [Ardenticatenaceae bacterium]MCB9443005.1 tetratricopeptide repeat protein [Ardenticatenaceae bacterium]